MGFWDKINPFGGMSGEQIYHNFRGGTGDDGFGLSASAFYVAGVAATYEERKASITKLTTEMESAWQGGAAGVASRGAGPLAVEHGLAKDSMTTAQTTMNDQFDAFRTAQRTVTEVPPTPDKPSAWDNLTSLGGAGRDYESQMTQVSAANEQNVAIMTAYAGVSEVNVERMPTTYGRITDDYAAVGIERPPPPTPPPGYVPPPKTSSRTPGSGSDSGSGSDYGSTGNPPPNSFNPQNPGTGSTNPSQTNPSEWRPPSTVEPPRGGLPPGQNPGQNPNNPNLPGMVPPGFGPGGGPGGGGQNTGRGFGPGGGRGFGPGGGGPGGGPGGSGAGGSGAGSPGAGRGGMGSGFGPGGAAAAEGAAARGGLGGPRGAAGGRGGMGGGMGGGGRRGEGEDDAEHERPSFLVEPDPHETFGTDEVTAPPVIGE